MLVPHIGSVEYTSDRTLRIDMQIATTRFACVDICPPHAGYSTAYIDLSLAVSEVRSEKKERDLGVEVIP